VSHKARARELAEQDPSEHDNRPLRSPYAPTRAHAPAGTPRHAAEAEHEPLRSPYAPKTARAPLSNEPDVAVGAAADADSSRRAAEEPREHPAIERYAGPAAERLAFDVDGPRRLCPDDGPGGGSAPATPSFGAREPPDSSPPTAFEACAGEPVDLDAPLQPADAGNSRRREPPAAERGDEIMSQLDLERLEASLRWLQRQEAATRLSRGAPPRPEPWFARGDARVRHDSGERFVDLHRSPLSLEPERLMPPPLRSRGDNLRGPLRIVMATCVAAPFMYYFLAGGSAPPSGPAARPQMASFDSRVVAAPPASSIRPPELGPTMAQGDGPGTSAEGEMPARTTETVRTGRLSERETVAMLQPGATGAQTPPSSNTIRALDPEEIKLLIKQGEQFVAVGDLVTARTVLQRAAEAGDATAAVALAATYDPTVLAKLGVMGMGADVEQARHWYQAAESLGSAEATRQLRVLAGR
jgi:hypothetical protein